MSKAVFTTVRGAFAGLAMAVATLALSGCGSSDDDKNYVEQPVEVLYNRALDDLGAQEYKAAAKGFEEVDRQHPYSEWARKALLMQAYAHYEARQYDEAIASAKRYVTLHPASSDAPYAQYVIASSYFDQIPDITRDQGRTEKAVAALDEVVRKYPATEYAASAKKKLEVARDNIAGKEMAIARYYLDKRDYTGAINRFKVVVTQYQTTRHVEEALMRLAECYMALGVVGEAQTAAAVLGHNFPDSRWYKDAYTLVKSGGHEPHENEGSWISKAFKKIGLG